MAGGASLNIVQIISWGPTAKKVVYQIELGSCLSDADGSTVNQTVVEQKNNVKIISDNWGIFLVHRRKWRVVKKRLLGAVAQYLIKV